MNTLQLQFLISILAGWVNRGQQDIIEYLQKENRVLREQLGAKRLLFTDVQRRRLAAKANKMGRKGLFEISTLVTPDTLLRWYRRLIARKLFIIDLQTRRVEIAGIARRPDGEWMKQIARNLSSRWASAIFGRPCGSTRSTTTWSAITKVGTTS